MGENKKCLNCEHRKVCWLRAKMNAVAVEAQDKGIANNAWVYFEEVAQVCGHYLAEEEG